MCVCVNEEQLGAHWFPLTFTPIMITRPTLSSKQLVLTENVTTFINVASDGIIVSEGDKCSMQCIVTYHLLIVRGRIIPNVNIIGKVKDVCS